MVKIKFLLSISICLTLCGIGKTSLSTGDEAENIDVKTVCKKNMNTTIKKIANKNEVIGMCISFIQKNTAPQISVYGKRNLTLELNVNENTLFKVASISKIITAIAIMQLTENNELDLNKDISLYLKKSFPHKYFEKDPITCSMLMSHTSSIKDGKDYSSFLERTHSENQVPYIYELLNAQSDIWIKRKPGTYFSYCNLNYGILATIIENVTGQRFDEYIQENILNPLDIDGGFNIQNIKAKEKISVLYRGTTPQADNYQGNFPQCKSLGIGTNGIYFSPQSGLRISIKDLSKFVQLFLNKGAVDNVRLLKEETIVRMEDEYWRYNGKNGDTFNNLFLSWGLGLQKTTNQNTSDCIMQNLNFIGHHGEAYGLIADMYYNREKNFGFIFISNGTYKNSGYKKGNKSRFYQLEEDVFDFIYTNHVSKIKK